MDSVCATIPSACVGCGTISWSRNGVGDHSRKKNYGDICLVGPAYPGRWTRSRLDLLKEWDPLQEWISRLPVQKWVGWFIEDENGARTDLEKSAENLKIAH